MPVLAGVMLCTFFIYTFVRRRRALHFIAADLSELVDDDDVPAGLETVDVLFTGEHEMYARMRAWPARAYQGVVRAFRGGAGASAPGASSLALSEGNEGDDVDTDIVARGHPVPERSPLSRFRGAVDNVRNRLMLMARTLTVRRSGPSRDYRPAD